MNAALAAAGGALIVAGLLGIPAGLRAAPTDAPTRPARQRQTRAGLMLVRVLRSRRTQTRLVVGLAAGIVVAATTGWLLPVVVVPVAAVGVPALLVAPRAAEQIVRLEAMQQWSRALAGMLTVGHGLEQAIIATLRSTPDPIRAEVTLLATRLQARWPTEAAVRAFAEDLDDATGDMIAANLLLAARRQDTHGISTVLHALAASVTADVAARRQIEADRAKPRATARWVTLISLAAVGLVLCSGYAQAYRSDVGQVVLVALLACHTGALLWLRAIATTPPLPRFLGAAAAGRGNGSPRRVGSAW